MAASTSLNSDLSEAAEDLSTYWRDDPDMLSLTKNYFDQARILVGGGIIRPGVQHPWMGNMKYDPSRVRVIDFSDNAPAAQQAWFSDARELNAHISTSTQEPGPQNRKLIIIEGLEPRILEVVGVHYGIPVSFFLGHCDEWIDVNFVDRACAKQSNPVYWRVSIPQLRYINTTTLEERFGTGCYGDWNIVTGNADRWVHSIKPDLKGINFRNLVSYLGMGSQNNVQGSGWISIVLVDPHLTKIQRQQMACNSESRETREFDLEGVKLQNNLFSEVITWNESSSSEQLIGFGTPTWSVLTTHRNHREALFDKFKARSRWPTIVDSGGLVVKVDGHGTSKLGHYSGKARDDGTELSRPYGDVLPAGGNATGAGSGKASKKLRPAHQDRHHHCALQLCGFHLLHGRRIRCREAPVFRLLDYLHACDVHPAGLDNIWK